MSPEVTAAIVAASVSILTLIGTLAAQYFARRATSAEIEARLRVRRAEDRLAGALGSAAVADIRPSVTGDENGNPVEVGDELIEADVPATTDPSVWLARERRDERLTLAALWDVTHGRLDLYHQIVTRQARRSFGSAQLAMAVGFILLVTFAILAAEAKTTAAAVSAGGLGAVGAAFAAYIGRTFIRSQESAASHLRAYFEQPLELSRYLAAERLLADAADLSAEQRSVILSALVRAIATAGREDGGPDENEPSGRR